MGYKIKQELGLFGMCNFTVYIHQIIFHRKYTNKFKKLFKNDSLKNF